MATRMNLLGCVLGLSIAAGLSGCASSPPPVVCPQPGPLPADLARPFPPEGWFQEELERILSRGQTSAPISVSSPAVPTK